MFKRTADSQADRTRTASHATKPFANGRIDVLPPWAKPQEELYESLKSQIYKLIEQQKAMAADASYLNERLKFKMAHEEYKRIQEQRAFIAGQTQDIQESLTSLRKLARDIGADNWRGAYVACAKAMLSHDQHAQIMKAADEMMGRETVELRPGKTELSEGRRQAVRDRDNRADKMERYQNTKERRDLAEKLPNANVGRFPDYYRKP